MKKEIITTLYTDIWDGSPRVFETKELVRCKDCKHIQSDGWCKYHRHSEKEEWYCADGERKEESK